MDELIPIYRIEYFIDAIINGTENPLTPEYGIEFYLAYIAGKSVTIPDTPTYRVETYLSYLCGKDVELPTPQYRIEFYYAKLCGMDVEVPDPIYRIEYFLAAWIEASGGIEKTKTGNPIHITDALAKPVQALSVAIEPIQDLNGYDNPWPAGGGVNKLPPAAVTGSTVVNGVTFTAYSDGHYHISKGAAGSSSAFCSFNLSEAVDALAGMYVVPKCADVNGSVTMGLRDADSSAIKEVYCGQPNPSAIQTTATATIFYLYVAYSVENIEYDIYPMLADSVLTTYSPYSNICPISGHTDADVTRTGVNVWDETYYISSSRIQSNYIPVLPNTTYNRVSPNNIIPLFCDINKTQISTGLWGTGTFTTPQYCYYIRFQVDPAYGETYHNDISINYPSTDTGYHSGAYNETYPISLGTTVYGGTLDVLTGVLTVDRSFITLNGTENFVARSLSGSFYYQFSGALVLNSETQTSENGILSSYYKSASWASSQSNDKCVSCFYYGGIHIRDTAYSSEEQLKTALASNPLQVIYPLATPTTIQLTPTQVELLLGENNIWSDGTMTLVYLADGNASDVEALNILLGNRYVNNHGEDEPTDREALDIVLGGNK